MFSGDILCQPAPPGEAHGPTCGIVGGDYPPCRTGTRDYDQLRAVECRQHRCERVPGVLANEERCPSPCGIERLNTAAGLHKAFFVEHTVRRQEDLPMDVTDAGAGSTQGGVDARVVEAVIVDLVESQRYVKRRSAGFLMLLTEIVKQLVCGNSEITNATLQEVPREGSFRTDEQIGRLGPRAHLPEKGAEAAEVLLVGSLVGTYLGNGKVEHG